MSELFTPQNYLRYLILCNGAIEYDEAIVKWKEKFPEEQDVPNKQNLYQSRNSLRIKYAVTDLMELPRKPTGAPIVAGLVRLLLKKNPSLDRKKCQALLASDGVLLTKENWRVIVPVVAASKGRRIKTSKPVKTTKMPTQVAASLMEGLPDGDPDDSPDDNQKVGHRAKLTRPRWIGKSRDNPPLPSVVLEPGNPAKTKVEKSKAAPASVRSDVEFDFEIELSELESRLDLMIENATIMNANMLGDLRKARRLISKSILDVTE